MSENKQQDSIQNFKETLSDAGGVTPIQLEASRGNDLRNILVDVAKRDIEDEGEDINIIIYLMPGVKYGEIKPPLRRACQELFGQQTGGFSTRFIDQKLLEHEIGSKIGLQTDGMEHTFDCFEITIHHPQSMLYSVDALKDVFTRTLKRKLDGV